MKKLMNLAIASGLFTTGFNGDYEAVRQFVRDHALDGIEMILYGDYQVDQMPKDLIVGHHLLYWPNWMDFWHGDNEGLLKDFLNEDNVRQYYGMDSRQEMVDYYRKEFAIAKEVKADYMVFHVSHASFEEIFTFEHKYDSKQVMTAAIELINEVFAGDGPMLLFENLWWPGLTYKDRALTQWFFDEIQYKNKGLLLDLSHLMATDHSITKIEEGITSIHKTLDDLGDLSKEIKAIHINKTIAGPYLKEDHSDRHQAFMGKKDLMEGFGMIYGHIGRIDSHQPFDHLGINSIIGRLKPKWVVFELSAKSVEALGDLIDVQNQYIRLSKPSTSVKINQTELEEDMYL